MFSGFGYFGFRLKFHNAKILCQFRARGTKPKTQNVWKPVRAEHPESANRRFHFSFFIFRENRPRRTELKLAVTSRFEKMKDNDGFESPLDRRDSLV